MTTAISVSDIQTADLKMWALPRSVREEIFATLRAEQPVAWQREFDDRFLPLGPGFWAITKHADIEMISGNPEVFCSRKGATSIPDMPDAFLEFFGNLINTDDPHHKHLRALVSAGFTPAQLKKLEEPVRAAAVRIVDKMIEKGEGDFIADIAAPFPIQVICDILGIPESLHEFVFEVTNAILGSSDPDYIPEGMDVGESLIGAATDLRDLMREMRAERLKNPTDDLTSVLVHAEIDGERISEAELCSFFVLVVIAGNETTRTAIAQGMHALCEFPDQRALLQKDFDTVAPTAVEEIVRWGTPVIFMRRTATRDTEVRGQAIKEGDKLVLWYNSGNRDEDVFDDPFRFDVLRNPNDHVGFGGPGPHFCLGANLARREITVIFREIFSRMPDMEVCGEPTYLLSNFINGIKVLPVKWTPGKPV